MKQLGKTNEMSFYHGFKYLAKIWFTIRNYSRSTLWFLWFNITSSLCIYYFQRSFRNSTIFGLSFIVLSEFGQGSIKLTKDNWEIEILYVKHNMVTAAKTFSQFT